MLDLYSAFLGKSFIFKVRKEDCHRIHSSVVLIMALSKDEYLRTRKEVMETGTQEKVSTPLNHFFFLPYARICFH